MIKHEIMALTTRIADVFRIRIVCVQRSQCVKSKSFADKNVETGYFSGFVK